MFLAKMTTEQAAQAFRLDPVILLPVGSCEQHGPQCALGTDFLIPDHLARQVEALPNLIVAPTVPYGVCPYHMSFAGSIDIGYEGLHHLLHSITFSLMQHGARRFLILNGHGGNNPAIDKTALEIYHAGGVCASIDWWSLAGQLDPSLKGGHGDILETSAMMAVDPQAVQLQLCQPMNSHAPSANTDCASIQKGTNSDPNWKISFHGGSVRLPRDTCENAPSGWFGPRDPADSTAAMGKKALDLVENFLREFIEEFRSFPLGSRQRPFSVIRKRSEEASTASSPPSYSQRILSPCSSACRKAAMSGAWANALPPASSSRRPKTVKYPPSTFSARCSKVSVDRGVFS